MYDGFLAGAIVAIAVHVGAFIYRWGAMNAKVENIEKKTAKISKLEKEMSALISELEKEISALKEFKTNAQKFIDSKLYSEKSPLSLTDFGKELVSESGLDKILEDSAVMQSIADKVKEMEPKTKYDVQEFSRAVMDGLTDYKPFTPIKEYAFENGKDLGQILRAGAILVRDCYIEKMWKER